MQSILPVNIDNISIVPVKVFEKRICDIIEKRTGKKLNTMELEMLDSKEVGRYVGIDRMRVTIIPKLLSKIVCLRIIAYNRALVSHSLMKKN